MANCTNPKAVNYDPNALIDDGSCIYLHKIGETCYAFQDLEEDEIEDKSFTLSWSLKGDNWVFFHDYIPDYYLQIRDALYSMKDNKIFKHHVGPFGKYYNVDINSFFVDIVMRIEGEGTLNALQWITEVLNANGSIASQETLTHITIWNSTQCTGRIPLSTVFKELQYETHRKTQGKWSFDNFRDKVSQEGVAFLEDLFNNFAVIGSALSNSLPWFEQQLLEDNYFVVRFEFDNVSGKKIYLHATAADISPSYR